MRYYYKNKYNTGFLNLKSPIVDPDIQGYQEITEEEFKELTKPKVYEPTEEQKAEQERAQEIAEYKKYLADTDYIVLKIAETLSAGDTETVATLRSEYASELGKRERARIIINSIEKSLSK